MFRTVICVVLVWAGLTMSAWAQINLQPKYGGVEKNAAQKAADAEFLAGVNRYFNNDRTKAGQESAKRGWDFLQEGNLDDAMRRFNQAWLLNSSEGSALWGMAVVQMLKQQIEQGMRLFEEAAETQSGNIDFAVDHARAMGAAAAATNNQDLLEKAWTRFEQNYQKAPTHTLNLQNWAISYYYVGMYPEAWQKVQLAEKTPRAAVLDQRFIHDLAEKMPRPQP